MKKETLIIFFYILYFSWLFTVTFLTADIHTLNIFTAGVTLFYFIFLREAGDIFWFFLSSFVPVVFATISFSDWTFKTNFSVINMVPLWLPLAWGTTIVALRKLYLVLAN